MEQPKRRKEKEAGSEYQFSILIIKEKECYDAFPNLPRDVLFLILVQLDFADLVSLDGVCKKFHQIFDNKFWFDTYKKALIELTVNGVSLEDGQYTQKSTESRM